jgi:hypothetical protein
MAGIGLAMRADAAGIADAEWFDRPMRWAQLTLVENDPGRYDPAFWLEYFRRIHADAACLSAGGVVAYYPTSVRLHHRSAWMGDGDPFGDLLKGCRALGMVVIARTDPHAAHQDVYDAHPDWMAVDAEGRKRRHWASPELWVTCALGPYNFELMTEVHREIVTRYDVDGIFGNRWSGSGMCYCEHCQQNFRAASGLALPRTNDPRDPARRAYLAWHERRLFELWRLPMEMVYPRTERTGAPQVFLREIGRGRVVYFPWDIDRVFWEVMSVDHGRLLANAVAWAANEDPPVTVTGPGLLDVTIWRQKQSLTVHLVNLTNPMMMKGPFRELLPLPEQRVRVKLPDEARPGRVQLLVGERPPRVEQSPGYVDVTVPSILDHEVVAIDLL